MGAITVSSAISMHILYSRRIHVSSDHQIQEEMLAALQEVRDTKVCPCPRLMMHDQHFTDSIVLDTEGLKCFAAVSLGAGRG